MGKLQPIFEDTFFGMDRRLDPDKIGDGYSPLALNVDLARLKTVRKRQGTALIGQIGLVNNNVQSIIEYININSQSEIHMVRNTSLYKYNGGEWETLAGGIFTGNVPVQSVQFKNRIYHVSSQDFLRWETGTVATPTIVNGNVKAKCMAVGQRTLFIGNVSFGGISYPNRVYYSVFDTTSGVPSDVFWSVIDGETSLATSTRFFEIEGGQVQSIVSFSNRNRVYIFSDTLCYSFDIDQVETNPFGALQEVFPIGCCGNRAICVIDAMMYWMDKLGKIWGWSGNTTRPEELSYMIDDENLGSSIISKIDKSVENMSKISAFGLGKRLYFNVGSIQIDGVSLPNCAIKMALSQNGLRANFSLDTFTDRFLCGSVVTLDNGKYLLGGNSNNVLLLNSGINDIDKDGLEIAIGSFYRTKSYHFNSPFTEKQVNSVMIKYRPLLIEDCFLTVKVSLNADLTWKTVTDPINEPARFGEINMYDEHADVKQQATSIINIPNDFKGLTFAFEFGNGQKSQSFEVAMWGTNDWGNNEPNLPLK